LKKFLKIVGSLLFLLLLVAGLALIYLQTAFPKSRPAQDISIEATPARLERGKYLANNVLDCFGCHGDRHWHHWGVPGKQGTEGAAGLEIPESWGIFPGSIKAPNITSVGIGDWTDGEVLRAMTEGIHKDGHALFPMMPYASLKNLDKEDVYSVIAYIRSLPPQAADDGYTKIIFPVNMIVRTVPEPVDLKDGIRPDPKKDKIAYGKYMAEIAGCMICHCKTDQL
jgi:hypothetical protein